MNKEQIIEDVDYFFVIHADICCTFPLRDILETHKKTGAVGTNMSVTVSSDNAMFFGCMVYGKTIKRPQLTPRPHHLQDVTLC